MARRNGVFGLVLFFVTFAVFSRVLQADFVAWDDDKTVPGNTSIQGLDAARLKWMFEDVSFAMRYKPLCWLSYALIHAGAGLNPMAYHLANLVLHCVNVVLVYFLIRGLLLQACAPQAEVEREPRPIAWCAALGALAWAVHPLRVEPVARVTDLAYCQSLFFLLISLWFYLRANTRPQAGLGRTGFYWGAVGAFALSMLSYPFAFGYAVVLMVLDIYPLRRFGRSPHWWRDAAAGRIWLEKVPFVLLGGLVLLTLLGRLNPAGVWAESQPGAGLTVWGKAMQAFYIWAYYLWKPCAPLHLAPVYTILVSFNPGDVPFLASTGLVVGLTAVLVWQRRRWPWALALWVCYLVLLAPALGLTEHPHYPSDRYSYVPGILWSVLLAGVLLKLWSQRRIFLGAVVVLPALIAILGVMSVRQTRVWRNSVSLFEYTLLTLGDDPYRADIHWRLGQAYAGQEKSDEAMHQFQEAIRLKPDHANAHLSLGITCGMKGQPDEAIRQFQEAIRLKPDYADAHYNLGTALALKGQVDEAISQFREAIRLKPDHAAAHYNLGIALDRRGQMDEAISQFQEAVRLKPDYAQAHNNLGKVLYRKGRNDEAIRHFQEALRIKADYADARKNLDVALATTADSSEHPGTSTHR
jgi:protein O-mannosyl-transferase